MAHAGGGHRPAATIDILPDEIFLEIFAFCVGGRYRSIRHRWEWQRLVHVCRRWRQIIYASPRYLDLTLWCSEGTPVENLSCWPEFPIAISYRRPYYEDDVVSLLKHHDRVCFVDLTIPSSQFGRVAAAMQEPFPVLRRLKLRNVEVHKQAVLPSGFLGGSAPCLQRVILSGIRFPKLPTFLLSSRRLVHLRLDNIFPTSYISPEAIVAGLSVLTKLETLHINFRFPTEQTTKHLGPPLQAVFPALTEFKFLGLSEYLEDLLALLDAPQLSYIRMSFYQPRSLRLPQLSLFIARTKNLRFTHAQVEFHGASAAVEIGLNQFDHSYEDPGPSRPRFYLSTSFGWPGTHVEHMSHVFNQLFAMFSNLGHLFIHASDDYPGWQDDIDSAEWVAFLRLFTTIETLHVSGMLRGQVARALEDIPEEMVTEVFPSLHRLWFEEDFDSVESTRRFISLREFYGRPVSIVGVDSEG